MATNEETELKNRMATLPTEQLLQIVRIDFADYRQKALAFAGQELLRRGFRQSDMAPQKLSTTVATDQPSNFQLTLLAIATGAIAMLLFPAIIYYSVLVYGAPAAAFILCGYGVWLYLRRNHRRRALAFAVGFVPPVGLILLAYSTAAPLYVLWLLVPLVAAVIVTRLATVLGKRAS
jgi:hypothetical protein